MYLEMRNSEKKQNNFFSMNSKNFVVTFMFKNEIS